MYIVLNCVYVCRHVHMSVGTYGEQTHQLPREQELQVVVDC